MPTDDGTVWVVQVEPAEILASPVVPPATEIDDVEPVSEPVVEEAAPTTVTAAKPVADETPAPEAKTPAGESPSA